MIIKILKLIGIYFLIFVALSTLSGTIVGILFTFPPGTTYFEMGYMQGKRSGILTGYAMLLVIVLHPIYYFINKNKKKEK